MGKIHTLRAPLRYLASIDYYAALAAADSVIIDSDARFNKRDKATHRTTIADANGVINLTVPIEKPKSLTAARWSDIVISNHDSWWNIHFTALRSAYGRTPFFEYYADDFAPFYTADCAGRHLADYDLRLHQLICRLLDIHTPVITASEASEPAVSIDTVKVRPIPYYQVRSQRHGFMQGMSIVDLLFNMGPESVLVLDEMVREL